MLLFFCCVLFKSWTKSFQAIFKIRKNCAQGRKKRKYKRNITQNVNLLDADDASLAVTGDTQNAINLSKFVIILWNEWSKSEKDGEWVCEKITGNKSNIFRPIFFFYILLYKKWFDTRYGRVWFDTMPLRCNRVYVFCLCVCVFQW